MTIKKRLLSIFIVMVIVPILIACDPPCREYLSIEHVYVIGTTGFLLAKQKSSFGMGVCEYKDYFYESDDLLQTWYGVLPSDTQIIQMTVEPIDYHVSECVPDDPMLCYRIQGSPSIEMTKDGGKTWTIDWISPPGREEYMDRGPEISSMIGVDPDVVPFDLTILAVNNGYFVLVALGNQGVLIKNTSGVWIQAGVPPITKYQKLGKPLPTQAKNITEAFSSIKIESNWMILGSILYFLVMSIVGWSMIWNKLDHSDRHKFWKLSVPFIVIATAGFIYGIVGRLLTLFSKDITFTLFESNIEVILCACPAIFIAAFFASWILAALNAPRKRFVLFMLFVDFGSSIILDAFVIVSLMLWALGVIPYYVSALVMMGSMCIVIILLTIIVNAFFASRAAKNNTNNQGEESLMKPPYLIN